MTFPLGIYSAVKFKKKVGISEFLSSKRIGWAAGMGRWEVPRRSKQRIAPSPIAAKSAWEEGSKEQHS